MIRILRSIRIVGSSSAGSFLCEVKGFKSLIFFTSSSYVLQFFNVYFIWVRGAAPGGTPELAKN